jgi:hypothetical protein
MRSGNWKREGIEKESGLEKRGNWERRFVLPNTSNRREAPHPDFLFFPNHTGSPKPSVGFGIRIFFSPHLFAPLPLLLVTLISHVATKVQG